MGYSAVFRAPPLISTGPSLHLIGPSPPRQHMDKDNERAFLETMSKALVSLPFDLKVLLEAVADPDLRRQPP